MPEQKVKVVVIREGLKPIYVAQVQEVDKETLFKLAKEAEQNLLEKEGEQAHIINRLIDRVEKLEKEVKYLKGEE